MGASTVLAATASIGSEAEFFLFIAFYGFLGYLYAVWTRRTIGTTPWRLPPIAWGLVSAMLPMFGLLLEMVARLTTRHASSRPGAGPTGPFGRGGLFGAGGLGRRPAGSPGRPMSEQPYGSAMQPGRDLDVSPVNPAGGVSPWPDNVATRPGPDGWRSTLRDEAGDIVPPPLFGWYPDPDGAHEARYWDGRTWTEFVRNGVETAVAPLGPWSGSTPWTPAVAGATTGAGGPA